MKRFAVLAGIALLTVLLLFGGYMGAYSFRCFNWIGTGDKTGRERPRAVRFYKTKVEVKIFRLAAAIDSYWRDMNIELEAE